MRWRLKGNLRIREEEGRDEGGKHCRERERMLMREHASYCS